MIRILIIILAFSVVCTAQIRTPSQTRDRASKRVPQSGGPGCCTYYVSNAGSDAAAGTTPATAWQTIAKVNATTLSPGQSVGFQDGGTWRETLTPGQSGSAGSPITFMSYGAGAQPIITAANLTAWTQGAGNPAQESCTGSCVFDSGMETGGATFTDWTTRNAIDIPVTQSMTNPAHGTYSARIGPGIASGNRGYLSEGFTALINTTYYFRGYYYFPSGALVGSLTDKIGTNFAGGLYLQATTNSSGNVTNLTLYDGTHGASYATGSCAIAANTYAYIEYSVKLSATVGGGQLWCNGTSLGSTFTTNNSSWIGAATVDFGLSGYASDLNVGAYIYLDDFQIATAGPIGAFNTGGAYPTTVWRASQASNPYYPNFGGANGIQEPNLAAVTGANEWYWDGSTYLYVYGPGSPASTVEIPTRTNAVTITGKSYLTINGLDVRGALTDGLYVTGSSGNLSVLNATVELNYNQGFYLFENAATVNNGLIQGSTFRYNGSSGEHINASHWANWTVTNNVAHDNSQVPIMCGPTCDHEISSGFHAYCGITAAGTGSVWANNQSYNNGNNPTMPANFLGEGIGIHIDTCTGVTVTGNVVSGNGGQGIFLEKNINAVASYNVMNANCVQPILYISNLVVKAGEGLNATGNKIYNNTSYGCYWGIYAGAYEDSMSLFSNNTYQNNLATGATNENFYADVGAVNDGTYGTGNLYTYNGWGSPATNFVFWCSGITGGACTAGLLSTYAAFATAGGSVVANTITSDPLFVNPGTGNFSLQAGSPAINAGVCIAGVTPCPTNIGAK